MLSATNSEKMSQGGMSEVSGARARLKSVNNHVRKQPTASHRKTAIPGKSSPAQLLGSRTRLATLKLVRAGLVAAVGSCTKAVSMGAKKQVEFQTPRLPLKFRRILQLTLRLEALNS
jgi:hypothetical protein